MHPTAAPHAPPFCPNGRCPSHAAPTLPWGWVRAGFFRRLVAPHRVQRYRCDHCGRYFSDQTFLATYWLKRPGLLEPIAQQLVQCAAFRQIARQYKASPQTVALHCARLGRQAQLFHERLRPKGQITEPLVLDSFQSFEYSQYHPTLYHVLVGKDSHFFHGFTDSELRRSGSMRPEQKRRRKELEATFGRPDPRSVQREVAHLLRIVAPQPQTLELHTDEHPDYPRAVKDLPQLVVLHFTVSSRAARTTRNPLFSINLLDLIVRHSGANHKRETIAFSKRRQSGAERMWVLLVWRNYVKWFSERKHEGTPAMRAGVCTHAWSWRAILKERLFPWRIPLPERWADYYWRRIPTRRIPNGRAHRLGYAG